MTTRNAALKWAGQHESKQLRVSELPDLTVLFSWSRDKSGIWQSKKFEAHDPIHQLCLQFLRGELDHQNVVNNDV